MDNIIKAMVSIPVSTNLNVEISVAKINKDFGRILGEKEVLNISATYNNKVYNKSYISSKDDSGNGFTVDEAISNFKYFLSNKIKECI